MLMYMPICSATTSFRTIHPLILLCCSFKPKDVEYFFRYSNFLLIQGQYFGLTFANLTGAPDKGRRIHLLHWRNFNEHQACVMLAISMQREGLPVNTNCTYL